MDLVTDFTCESCRELQRLTFISLLVDLLEGFEEDLLANCWRISRGSERKLAMIAAEPVR
jgi:hypothetical protein